MKPKAMQATRRRAARWTKVLVAAVFCMTANASPPSDAARWQAQARNDLDAAHAVIIEAHPGMLDPSNPEFRTWAEDGYEAAKALIPNVTSYDTALAAVRYYTSGFEDAHLFYSDDIRGDFTAWVTGWMVRPHGGHYEVTATLDPHDTTLPPLGATWIGCDGQTAAEVLRSRVGPFTDRRPLAEADATRARMLWFKRPVADGLRHCAFETPAGGAIDLPVRYRAASTDQLMDAWTTFTHTRRENGFDVRDGVLWLRAADFAIDGAGGGSSLDALLSRLRAVHGVHTIVFDVRGNRGGDSSVGDAMFDAATGGLVFDRSGLDRLPRYYAQWRVSEYLVRDLRRSLDRVRATYGAGSPRAREDDAFLGRVQAALASGDTWVEQDAGPRLTQSEVRARHGHLQRFGGTVALLTDEACVSACLDFADVVLRVPGALHLGRTTDADSVYMMGTSSRMPSGNKLVVPVKVWRNRVRGNNEPLVPAVSIDLDRDEATIRRDVLRAIASSRRRVPHAHP